MCIPVLKFVLRLCQRRKSGRRTVRPTNNPLVASTFNSSASVKESRFKEVQTLMNQLAASQRNSKASEPSADVKYFRRLSLPADPRFYQSIMSRHSSANSGNLSVDEYKDVGGVLILDVQLRQSMAEDEFKRGEESRRLQRRCSM